MTGRAESGASVSLALLVSGVVHGLFWVLFTTASAQAPSEQPVEQGIFCQDMRCDMLPTGMDRRPAESFGQNDVLEAMIIPRLGLRKDKPKHMPRIQKYEQPEKTERSVNIRKRNRKPEKVRQANKAKQAELDRRRKEPPKPKSLAEALNNPDPRARATSLEKIVGLSDGSTIGTGTERRAGDPYVGQVVAVLNRSFKTPAALDRSLLRRLKVVVKIEKISANGEILSFRIIKSSGNRLFDAAALAAIRKYVPSEGGSKKLPKPTLKDLARLKGRSIRATLRHGAR
jgi:TonB family protein